MTPNTKMAWTQRTVFVNLMVCFFCLSHLRCTSGIIRKYYIAAQDIQWDYADSTQNLVNQDQQSYADTYLKQGPDRIGRRYVKTTYFQYTDGTFSKQIAKPDYLGILGPTIRGEVGDAIEVLYMNNATGTYSAHPHGVFYLKQHEGALYMDGTSGRYKHDEIVLPGNTVKLMWNITDRDAPGDRDPNCIPWVYHSHVNTVKDTSAGLVGALVTCKKGILNDQNERTDVDLDIPILLKIYDENLSWHLDKNIAAYCQDPAVCNALKDAEDEDFVESNYMHSLNGKMFGHLKGLETCVGDKIAFYVLGFGNEFDVHSLYFQGQNLNYQHTRGDTISVYTATFVAAETTPTEAGTWIVSDMVDGMARTGMSAFYTTKNCHGEVTNKTSNEIVREYFVSAETVDWDYGPGGIDLYTGKPLKDVTRPSSRFFTEGPSKIGGVYKKARFFQYSDDTFSLKIKRSSDQEHMGILGPVIEAEVGDIVKVILMNKVSFPVSFLPHALSFNYTEEIGNVVGDQNSITGIVNPGSKHTYTFKVPSNLLDASGEACHNYVYTSGVHPTRDHNTGLVGPILICRKGHRLTQPKRKSLFVFLSMFDENESMLLDENISQYLPGTSIDKTDEGFKNSNIVYAINGLAYGTIRGLTMCYDEDVEWYTMALGSNEDVHSAAFDGNTFTTQGKNRNIQSLVAGSNAALYMKPDNIGSWLVQSMTAQPKIGGAYGLYKVDHCGNIPRRDFFKTDRVYFIAATETLWDYAPLERSLINGADLNNPQEEANIFVRNDEEFIGDVYEKAVFRQYTDSMFTTQEFIYSSEKHMGLLGPPIRAEVNDKITVHFKNKASRPYSMHPHGLKYSHRDSGKSYNSSKADVAPGEIRTYTWYIPPRSGPGPNDPDCIPWMYYSAVEQIKDVLSGLMGPVVICRPGTLDAYGRRKNNEKEFFILMSVFNENLSWYIQQNVIKFATKRIGTDYSSDPDFEESNKMHAINGRLFGNNEKLVMPVNATIHWYFMVMGGKDDLHTIHTHGHTFIDSSNGHRDDVMSMFPGMAEAVEMRTENPGTWLLHCHVLDHISAGMETTYTVTVY